MSSKPKTATTPVPSAASSADAPSAAAAPAASASTVTTTPAPSKRRRSKGKRKSTAPLFKLSRAQLETLFGKAVLDVFIAKLDAASKGTGTTGTAGTNCLICSTPLSLLDEQFVARFEYKRQPSGAHAPCAMTACFHFKPTKESVTGFVTGSYKTKTCYHCHGLAPNFYCGSCGLNRNSYAQKKSIHLRCAAKAGWLIGTSCDPTVEFCETFVGMCPECARGGRDAKDADEEEVPDHFRRVTTVDIGEAPAPAPASAAGASDDGGRPASADASAARALVLMGDVAQPSPAAAIPSPPKSADSRAPTSMIATTPSPDLLAIASQATPPAGISSGEKQSPFYVCYYCKIPVPPMTFACARCMLSPPAAAAVTTTVTPPTTATTTASPATPMASVAEATGAAATSKKRGRQKTSPSAPGSASSSSSDSGGRRSKRLRVADSFLKDD